MVKMGFKRVYLHYKRAANMLELPFSLSKIASIL